jgi:hypothetical protein
VRRALLLAVLLLAGCGGSDDGSSERRTVDPAAALVLNGEDVTVRGYFSHEAGTILPRMCTALAESYPPSCGMPSLPVSNLTDQAEGKLPLKRDPETGGRWSEAELELSGRIEDGALVVQ